MDLNKEPPNVVTLNKVDVDMYLKSIMIEHKTRLVMVRSSKKILASKSVVDYICHRGGTPRRRGNVKRKRASKKCGCPFKVQVETKDGNNEANIYLSTTHIGHDPGSRSDLYHLPIHPSVIECCMQDLFDVGNDRYVAQMSSSKERFHMERASLLDCTIFRFFMIPHEINILSYQMRNQGIISTCFYNGNRLFPLRRSCK